MSKLSNLALFAMSVAALALAFASSATAAETCGNEGIRAQQGSAYLLDCRAYEVVTPPDTDGRTVEGVSTNTVGTSGGLFPTDMITAAGDGVAFTTFNGPLGELGATGSVDSFGVQRQVNGWSLVRRFSPLGNQTPLPVPGGISQDHLFAFTKAPAIEK